MPPFPTQTRGHSPATHRRRAAIRARAGSVPPTGLVMLAVASVQIGSGIATHLFQSLQPGGAAFLRVGFAAVVLLAVWRPRLRGYPMRAYGVAAAFGLVTAAMNFSFYAALDRVPLGVAVTLEFVGPLGVAVVGSRRVLDLLWAALAAGGILLLAPWSGSNLDPLGVFFALLAGGCWATYIFLSARVGSLFPGGGGLALAMTVGGLGLLPVGVVTAGSHLLQPQLLLIGCGVALLSSVIPYSLEMEALRSLPTRVFGVLMSMEPAMAAIVGFLLLHQLLGIRAVAALVFVTVASYGAARRGGPTLPAEPV